MKTIIQIYKMKYVESEVVDGIPTYFGIGDFLRSTLGLYNLSKTLHFNLIIDLSLHPISEYIQSDTHQYSDLIKSGSKHLNLLIRRKKIIDFIKNSSDDVILMFGWMGLEVYDSLLSDDAEKFMKSILKPNEIMKGYIDAEISQFPFKKYNIIHYRSGDADLFNNKDFMYDVNHFIKNYEENDILMSDSNKFKKIILAECKNVFAFNTNIVHLGKAHASVCDTLFELFIMINASRIKSYTTYRWCSGFAKVISFIYKIPLIYETEVQFVLKKCIRKNCVFITHSNIKNNGGEYCCLSCKQSSKHGVLCERKLFLQK